MFSAPSSDTMPPEPVAITFANTRSSYGTLLEIEPYADEPHNVGFRLGEQEFGLDRRVRNRS